MAGTKQEREHVQAVEATCEIQATAETLRTWDHEEACLLVELYELNRQAAVIQERQCKVVAALRRGDLTENRHHGNIGPLARVAAWFLDTLGMRPAVA